MSSTIMKGAEPLFIEGSTTGCLLLHGAGGGTSWDLKEFADVLHQKTGMTVWLPLLTGFGTKPEDLLNITFNMWVDDAVDGVNRLQQTCSKINIVGHSFGGLLASLIASKDPSINSIVLWATPYGIKNRLLSFLPFIQKIPLLNRLIPETFPTPAPDELKKLGWVGYEWLPSSLGMVFLEGLKTFKKGLINIKCPVCIIQGTDDEMVSFNSPKKIYHSISSEKKELWMIEGAHHPLMNEDQFKLEVFERSLDFLISQI